MMPSDAALLAAVPVVGGRPPDAPDANAKLPDVPQVVVRIPDDFSMLLAGELNVARGWRASARRAFLHYLPRGYRVTAFVPGHGGDAAYLLSR